MNHNCEVNYLHESGKEQKQRREKEKKERKKKQKKKINRQIPNVFRSSATMIPKTQFHHQHGQQLQSLFLEPSVKQCKGTENKFFLHHSDINIKKNALRF